MIPPLTCSCRPPERPSLLAAVASIVVKLALVALAMGAATAGAGCAPGAGDVGCGPGWSDVGETARIEAVHALPEEIGEEVATLSEWRGSVRDAADVWSFALLEAGCSPAPFGYDARVGDRIHPVRLVAPDDWIFDRDWTGATTPDTWDGPPGGIYVRADEGNPDLPPTLRYRHILLHEFGHAIGLSHGDSPIMRQGDSRPTDLADEDVAAAAEALGCAP